MKGFKTIDLCELAPELVKEYTFIGVDKIDLLAILKIFREWVENPTSRTLKIVSENGIINNFSLSSGVCGNISCIYKYFTKKNFISGEVVEYNVDLVIMLHKIFIKWSKYSGEISYPIPNPYIENPSVYDNEGIYRLTSQNGRFSMYDKATKYGQLRLELLDFIIECIENDFNLYVVKWRK
ncbi:hypothetical protein vBAbaMD22_148 [Acinetobacter phage vB_AbaM_D22]|nr:hypothetical protein vBAbaMD22_148 [Acinetobacter phage vB_AbaM_D22]